MKYEFVMYSRFIYTFILFVILFLCLSSSVKVYVFLASPNWQYTVPIG